MLELDVEPASPDATTGIVGARQLVCVQTFDIARLTTHPVVLRPGSFVAVGGRGPRGDSNESGKTSFLAATALLLGDPEWRMSGGGPAAAASLLFEPETAGVSAHTYAAAREGFVIGVFTEPERPAEAALTVWCRINATNPYFQVRYAGGVHLVEGDTDRERHLAADSGWESMPARTQLGAHHYAERLYGDSPRCLAYVARRGKQRSAPSLLQMNAGGFSPERIGEDLIHLTGRAAAFENEGQQRQRLDEAQRTLAERQHTDERARAEEEAQLAGVRARNAAREHLAQAEDVWRLHFARGYLDVLGRERELTHERDEAAADVRVRESSVADAQGALDRMAVPDELRSQHAVAEGEANRLHGVRDDAVQVDAEARVAVTAANKHAHELEQVADGWTSPTADQVAGQLATARSAADEAQQSLGAAKTLRSEAEERVRAAEAGIEGRAGATVQLLRESGIEAAPLMDVELVEAARPVWESRLALYEPAVVVAPGRMEDALRAVSHAPGTAAGVLDGRRATTHWAAATELGRRYPRVRVDPEPIFVRDGKVWTSAGVTAGMDLALALVEEDHSRDVALTIARHLVLFLRRPGNQSQFSATLAAHAPQRAPLREVQRYAIEHLAGDLSVEALAVLAHMSPRHFARTFRAEVGLTPARYVERLRLEAARRRLEEGEEPLADVAAACGFGTAETMRRLFLRVLGIGPSEYRRRFHTTVAAPYVAA